MAGSVVLGITQLEKALRSRKGISQRREDQEAALRERWALELAGHIQDAKLPCATRIEAMGGGKQAWCRAFGNRRGKTLRNRARAWGSFKAWLTISYGLQWPTDSGHILRYLEERHAATPLGKSVPNGLMAAFSLLETVGMVAPDRMADDRLLVESVRSWTTELENGAAPVKSAPMMTVSVILACELLVCSPSYPDGMRYMAFLLIMIWTSLRADDTQNIEPVRLSQIGLRFVLKRTKTSGAGRKVGELHAFISRVAGVSGYDWLLVGMRLHELMGQGFPLPGFLDELEQRRTCNHKLFSGTAHGMKTVTRRKNQNSPTQSAKLPKSFSYYFFLVMSLTDLTQCHHGPHPPTRSSTQDNPFGRTQRV